MVVRFDCVVSDGVYWGCLVRFLFFNIVEPRLSKLNGDLDGSGGEKSG